MLSFIFRVLIVCTVFAAGAVVGNIYMPHKNLEHQNIVALDLPETSFKEQDAKGLQASLNALTQMSSLLQQTQITQENLFTLEDTIKKQLYADAFAAARSEYELQLLKTQKQPQNPAAFLKARARYYEVANMTAQAFPPNPLDEIIVLDNTATQQVNIPVSAEAAAGSLSTQTAPAKEEIANSKADKADTKADTAGSKEDATNTKAEVLNTKEQPSVTAETKEAKTEAAAKETAEKTVPAADAK